MPINKAFVLSSKNLGETRITTGGNAGTAGRLAEQVKRASNVGIGEPRLANRYTIPDAKKLQTRAGIRVFPPASIF